MANTIRIKRRASGLPGAPSTLENAELAFNEIDNTLYYGKGSGGVGGTASTIEAIGGVGAFVSLSTNQTVTGNKTFSGTVALGSNATANTPTAGDNSTKVATTAYVETAISNATYTYTLAADVGTSQVISDEETVTISGGVGLSSSITNANLVTINLDNTTVEAGPYGSSTQIPTFTVDAQGRLTSAGTALISTTLDIAADTGTDNGVLLGTDTLTISGGTGINTSVSGDTITVNLSNTTVAANTYGSASNVPVFAVNGQGQITGVTNTAISIASTAVTDFEEAVEDVVGGLIIGTSNEVNVSYNDNAGTLAIGLPDDVTITRDLNVGRDTVITGNLTVHGTTTTINSTTLTVDDKNIELASVASPTDASADGAGITVKGTTDKTFNWVDTTDAWTSSEHMNLLVGKEYYINGVKVLSATSLGTGVTSSSLTSVGTISSGIWQGTAVGTAYGGTGATNITDARANLGLAIGIDVQAYDIELAALASLVSAADKLPYFTGSGTAALTTFTTFGRSLIDDIDAPTARTTLGLGTIAVQNSNNVSITGGSISSITLDNVNIDGGTF